MTTTITDLVGQIESELAPIFEAMDWAEDEIARAQRRHPEQADRIYHAFGLLLPTSDLMGTEFVYRAHARELLARVASGQDTRPGTNVEVILALSETSHLAPLNTTATALYIRLWERTFPQHAAFNGEALAHYEYVAHDLDGAEADIRRRLTVPKRQLDDECSGQHHGEPATGCPLYRASQAA